MAIVSRTRITCTLNQVFRLSGRRLVRHMRLVVLCAPRVTHTENKCTQMQLLYIQISDCVRTWWRTLRSRVN